MKAKLLWETRAGAGRMEHGEQSDLAPRLERLPPGAQLVLDEGPHSGEVVGGVDACDGACDAGPGCTGRHWWYQR